MVIVVTGAMAAGKSTVAQLPPEPTVEEILARLDDARVRL